MINIHQPVLLEPILKIFQQEIENTNSAMVFDGTFGGGSYSKEMLNLGSEVWATDLDPMAEEIAGEIKKELAGESETQSKNQLETSSNTRNKSDRLHFIAANFAEQINNFEDNLLDLAVLDLGFSSNQLEIGQHGFSYLQQDQLFDLRFNPNEGIPAYDYISKQTTDKLGRTIFEFSGESMARRIAESLITTCRAGKFKNSDITEAILQVIPAKLKHKKFGIYSRVWQALRIAINGEFDSLNTFLKLAPSKIKKGGIIAIVCFHSLEDKMVTKTFRNLASPIEVDDFGNKEFKWKMLTPHAILPEAKELEENNRARSATLRIIKKL